MKGTMTMRGIGVVFLTVACIQPVRALGQDLADYDYENLSLRGISFAAGRIFPNNVDSTDVLGVRFDLGFLGPGFRLIPGVSYWTSTMTQSQVGRLESRVDALNASQGGSPPPGGLDLGTIDRSDLIVSLDGQYLWSVPLGLFFWAGAGLSAHFLNGSGASVDGTFVEDLLDSVGAGFNVQAGLEYPISDRVRLYGGPKFELLGDLTYVDLRVGLSFIWGSLAQGEAR